MSLKFSNFLREIKENNRELFDLWMAKNKQNPNKEVSGDNFEFAVYDKLTDFGYTVYSTEQEKSRYVVAGHDDLNAYLQEIKDFGHIPALWGRDVFLRRKLWAATRRWQPAMTG